MMKKLICLLLAIACVLSLAACAVHLEETQKQQESESESQTESKPEVTQCVHEWEVLRDTDATCEEAGKVEYRCSKCGEEKEETKGKALGHSFEEEHEYEDENKEILYYVTYNVCERCGHKEFVSKISLGDYKEYRALMEVVGWLIQFQYGAMASTTDATVEYLEENDYYMIVTSYTNYLAGKKGAVVACVEVGAEDEYHLFYANLDGEVVVNETRKFGN